LIIFRKRVSGLTSAALANFVGRAGRALGLRGGVNVLVTSSQELRALNNLFRHKDKATDVLSFPPMVSDGFAGDIAISAQIASQNAKLLGHSAATEIKILALHGILHLAGYDHERDQGEMERKEARLRKTLGLPVGLIERSVAGRKRVVRKPAPSARRASPR
jgi:probable rRNA maturation factor